MAAWDARRARLCDRCAPKDGIEPFDQLVEQFSVAQRKVLAANNFPDLGTLEQTPLAFGRHHEQIAQPFEWKFTRQDLHQLLDRLEQPTPQLQLAA